MTGLDIYNRSLVLLGELNGDGETQPDTAVFKQSALELINTLLIMTYSFDRMAKGISDPDCTVPPQRLTSLDEEITSHPILTASALPFGLCFLLVHEEDTEKGMRFYRLYAEELRSLERIFKRGKASKVKNVY